MKVFTFAAGLAAGYVLGSRAGREKYEQIVAGYQKVSGHPAVAQATDKAKERLSSGASTLTAKWDPTTPDEPTDLPIDTTGQPARRRGTTKVAKVTAVPSGPDLL